MPLEYVTYAAYFFLGFSVSEIISYFGLVKHIKRIAEVLEKAHNDKA